MSMHEIAGYLGAILGLAIGVYIVYRRYRGIAFSKALTHYAAVGFSLALVAGALMYLALGNFGENLVYFFTPSEVAAFSPERFNKKVRVGGMVVKGSVKSRTETVGMTFALTDGAATIPVTFEGIPPDLFKEGQGAVVEGVWTPTQEFHSTMIMAKHSEDYMPIELKRAGTALPKKDLLQTLRP